MHKPNVVFLSKTLVHYGRIEDLQVRLGFESCFSVDRLGHAGGLAVLWRIVTTVSITAFSSNFIDMNVLR